MVSQYIYSSSIKKNLKVIKNLVQKIAVGVNSIKIHYYMGSTYLKALKNALEGEKMCSSSLTAGARGQT